MHSAVIVGACLGVLLLLGACERLARDRAHRAVPIRIHVNGTRGKSTVTRLIWGALREAGIPAIAKTTGTAARVLMPDGTERPVPRHAPPSVREQLWLLRQAHRAGARAVVAECMAIQPELQWTSEREMLSATIGIITNVRMDHTDAMGTTLDRIAESLANTIPVRGLLIVGDRRFLSVFERRATVLGTRVVATTEANRDAVAAGDWELQNRAIALEATRHLGIPDRIALDGMQKVRPDPGVVRAGTLTFGGRHVPVVDATAANDPESLALLLARPPPAGSVESEDLRSRVMIYNHREDRATRLHVFASESRFVQIAGHLLLTGDRPSRTLLRFVRARRGGRPVQFAARRHLREVLARLVRTAPEVASIVFCGNAKRLDVISVFREELQTYARPSVSNS